MAFVGHATGDARLLRASGRWAAFSFLRHLGKSCRAGATPDGRNPVRCTVSLLLPRRMSRWKGDLAGNARSAINAWRRTVITASYRPVRRSGRSASNRYVLLPFLARSMRCVLRVSARVAAGGVHLSGVSCANGNSKHWSQDLTSGVELEHLTPGRLYRKRTSASPTPAIPRCSSVLRLRRAARLFPELTPLRRWPC